MFIDVLTPHYSDVIMSAMASQTTGISIIYLIVSSDADQRRASNEENASIWWRHHELFNKDIENRHSDANETSVTNVPICIVC